MCGMAGPEGSVATEKVFRALLGVTLINQVGGLENTKTFVKDQSTGRDSVLNDPCGFH